MKFTKLFIGALLMAASAFAGAANFSSAYSITLQPGDDFLTGGFNKSYTNTSTGFASLKGLSFEDTITFTLPSYNSVASSVSSTLKSVQGNGIQFTSFSLYEGNRLVVSGDTGASLNGKTALGELTYDTVQPAGIYKLVVDGTFIGKSGGSYAGTVSVTPVPEPETWGMTVSGLLAVGFLARRRKVSGGKAA